MGSADWMPRNLDKRVEILFPVEAKGPKEEGKHILEIQLAVTLKAHVLQKDGLYEKVDRRGKEPLCAQEYFAGEAWEMAEAVQEEETLNDRVFVPEEPVEE